MVSIHLEIYKGEVHVRVLAHVLTQFLGGIKRKLKKVFIIEVLGK